MYAVSCIYTIKPVTKEEKDMAKTITVTTSTLKSKANELKSLNSKLKSHINSLRSGESSLNSMWDGEANDAFHKAFTKDATQMDNFYNAIEKYVQALQEIAKKYDAAEQKNVGTATKRK